MSSYFSERQTRSMKTLSIQRPRPSIEMRTPASMSAPVKAAAVNWLTIGVENLRLAVSGQCFFQRSEAERGVHRVGEPPGENGPARPVDDRDQIEEAPADRDVRVSRPKEFHLRPLSGRVGDWRAGLGRCLCSPLARSFVRECHIISTMPRFQPPPRRTQHADFPHCAHLFASPRGLWDLSCRSRFRLGSYNAIAVEEAQLVVHPLPIPPLPIEAPTIPSALHMAPDLLFHPVFDEAEALAGMSDREVIHPPT